MSHWDAMALQVPVRKWYIQRWNKVQEEEGKQNQPSTDRPLTESERGKMISQAQQVGNSPPAPSTFMTPRRNLK
jgi:hypothetical protein